MCQCVACEQRYCADCWPKKTRRGARLKTYDHADHHIDRVRLRVSVSEKPQHVLICVRDSCCKSPYCKNELLAINNIHQSSPTLTPEVPESKRGRGPKLEGGRPRNEAGGDPNLSVKGTKNGAPRRQTRSWLGMVGTGSIHG